jgi:hypothetical protein
MGDAASVLYAEDKYDITRYHKSIKRQVQSKAAEEKVEEKQKLKQKKK